MSWSLHGGVWKRAAIAYCCASASEAVLTRKPRLLAYTIGSSMISERQAGPSFRAILCVTRVQCLCRDLPGSRLCNTFQRCR